MYGEGLLIELQGLLPVPQATVQIAQVVVADGEVAGETLAEIARTSADPSKYNVSMMRSASSQRNSPRDSLMILCARSGRSARPILHR